MQSVVVALAETLVTQEQELLHKTEVKINA
jgi:hypothetical protein